MLKSNENQVRKLKYKAEILVRYGLNCPLVSKPACNKNLLIKLKSTKLTVPL